MRVTVRLWAATSFLLVLLLAVPTAVGAPAAVGLPGGQAGSGTQATPGLGVAPPDLTPLVSGLAPFPSNLTHFIYIVRENHVFDDYLGDCHSTINSTCDNGVDHTSQTNHIADVPFLHQWGRTGSVFDNMYSSVDPYSAQGHAYLFAADINGGSDSCSNTVQGMGSGTQWGIYNNSNVKSGSCGYSPDLGSQAYPTDGTVFDRFTGPNVAQSGGPIPFLAIGDNLWELGSGGSGLSCSVGSTTGIPGSLPGNSVAVEHTTCSGVPSGVGFWTNTTSGSVQPLPPVVNPANGIPQLLYDCQFTCSNSGVTTMNDQYAAYAFLSYLKDYGLPTYTEIELMDDHPGPYCTSSSFDTCIQWNDQSMNLIVQAVENNTALAKNTVIAISEDDTQDGANGPDSVNSGRRFPFVLVADPSVMKTGNPNPASCGITTGPCGNIVHQTFNTSNVLAVMERVELNVNPTIFASSLTKLTFPMATNDMLAEGNPLEPVWRCGDPRVPCNTGTGGAPPTLTSTAISPDPVGTSPGTTVALSASATDQSGASIGGATFAWSQPYPSTLGSVSPAVGASTTYTPGSSAGSGHLCENATYSGVTLMGCAPITVSASATLANVVLSPLSTGGPPNGVLYFNGSATNTLGGGIYPSNGGTFLWNVGPSTLGTLNATLGTTAVRFVAGSGTGSGNVCLNVTYASTTRLACAVVVISTAPPTLASATLVPKPATVATGGTLKFDAQAMDQYGQPLYASTVHYSWSVSPSSLGSVNVSVGSDYQTSTYFTAGPTAGYVNLSVQITDGPAIPIFLWSNVTISSSIPPLTAGLSASVSSGAAPLSVTFSGTVAGGTGTGYTESWNFGDGSAATSTTGATPQVSHVYTGAGTFVPSMSVQDSRGGTPVVVTGNPVAVRAASGGTLAAHASSNPTQGPSPLQVQFTGSASGGTAPYTYLWTFGVGSASSTQANASYTYTADGSYVVILQVTDATGASSQATLNIVVGSGTSTTSNGGAGPLGLTPLEWGIVVVGLVVVVAAAAVAIAVRRSRQSRGPPSKGESGAGVYAGYPPSGPPGSY